jgi:arabinan endo-1,5-alpha-L-arabinosidase
VIGMAVSKSLDAARPDCRWEDRGLVIASAPGQCDFNAIDPAPFVAADGTPYLFWGSFWSGIKAARLDAAGKLAGSPPQIVPVAARARDVAPPAIEGAYVVWHRGYYYLFVSWDLCCDGLASTYKIMVGRSPAVLGPYVDREGRRLLDGGGTLVLASSERWRGPGHNSVLQTSGGDWLVHHTYDAQHIKQGRILQIRPLNWPDDWPSPGEPARFPEPQGYSPACESESPK